MSFKIDKQTLNDLVILGNNRSESVYNIFNRTRTRGGSGRLKDMFTYPLSDVDKINKRSSFIHYFFDNNIEFPFRSEIFDPIEFYLSNTDRRTQLLPQENMMGHHLKNLMNSNTEYSQIHLGIVSCIELLNSLDIYIQNSDKENSYVNKMNEKLGSLIYCSELEWFRKEKKNKKLSYNKAVKYDKILRFEQRERLLKTLHYVYLLDVYIAASNIARTKNFTFAKAVEGDKNVLNMKGVFHPFLKNPVDNTISIDEKSNIIFLTGANMAGKSTFMKSFGITIFLAHIGFPVPAKEMEFSIQNGMYTTINLPDNLNMGYSHFYAEVLRLKKVAIEVRKTQHLIIVFDELFRGTNVKDAYDATIAVTEAFSGIKNCIFMISTHIMEAGEVLKKQLDNINFVYLPTEMNGNTPVYTYKLASGITDDRHGMMIINNEKIIDIINQEN